MKKLFTFIVALAATLSAGAQQLPLTGSATIPMPSTQPLTVSCPATWDGVNLAGDLKVKPAEYPKAVIEIDAIDGEGAENFSLLCKANGATYAFESNVTGEPKKVAVGKIEYSLKTAYSNWVWGTDLSDKTFDELTIKSRKDNQSVTIKSFYLIDNDDNLVPTNYKLLATASAPIYSANVTFASKWNDLGGAGWASGEVGSGDFVIYSILLNTPFEGSGLQFKFNDGADHYDGSAFVEGTTAVYLRKDVAINSCSVQRNGESEVSLDVKAAAVNINKLLIEMPASGMTTFSYDKAVEIPSGVKAYYASAQDGSKITMTPFEPADNIIKAQFPVLLVGEPSIVTASLAGSEGTAWPGGNLLKPNAANSFKALTAAANQYVLSEGKFYSLNSNGAKIPPYKAYLQAAPAAVGAPSLEIVFGGGTTGIGELKNSSIDGLKSGAVYNLNGQRVQQPTKGLYIVNGKKVVMK